MSLVDDLSGQKFDVIVADPPWSWASWSKKNQTRAAENHYQIMSLKDIKELPVGDISSENCALFLWCINSMLPQAFEVIDSWGFKFSTVAFTWVKRTKLDTTWHFGLGYWTRQNTEQCLLATKGTPKRKERDVPQLIVSPRREHSRKPDKTFEYIERLIEGNRCELFSREKRSGWDSWGLETSKFAEGE